MTGKEKLRRTGTLRDLILRSLLFFPADMYLRNRYIVIVHRGIFTRSFFVIFRFVGVHFRNRYIVVGQIVIMLFSCLFFNFSKTFSLSSQLQNIDKKVITRLLIKSANKLPIRGIRRYAFTEGT